MEPTPLLFERFVGEPIKIEISGSFYDKTREKYVEERKVIEGRRINEFKNLCATLKLEKLPPEKARPFFEKEVRFATRSYFVVVLNYADCKSKTFTVLAESYVKFANLVYEAKSQDINELFFSSFMKEEK